MFDLKLALDAVFDLTLVTVFDFTLVDVFDLTLVTVFDFTLAGPVFDLELALVAVFDLELVLVAVFDLTLLLFRSISFVLTTLLELTGTGIFLFVVLFDRNCTGSATFSRSRRFLIAFTMSVFFAPLTMTAFTFLATFFRSPTVDDFLKRIV